MKNRAREQAENFIGLRKLPLLTRAVLCAPKVLLEMLPATGNSERFSVEV
jgi:hypothetical protein